MTPTASTPRRLWLIDALAWGSALWAFGYIVGFILFAFVPPEHLGWYITPFGVAATIWVLWTRVRAHGLGQFAVLSGVWTLIALLFDYLFIVLLLKPEDGYYKLDVYLYYGLTLALPLIVGWLKGRKAAA
jgi:hypothetical protein